MNLDRLINRYLDGRAEPDEVAQLAELLKHDDDAATTVWKRSKRICWKAAWSPISRTSSTNPNQVST